MEKLITNLSIEFNYKIYSAVFRVLLFGILFIELCYNFEFIFYFFKELDSPNEKNAIINLLKEYYGLFFFLYAILLILGILGIGKNITCVFIYVFFNVQNILFPFGIWIEKIIKINLLFLCFIDSFYYLSVNKNKIKYNTIGNFVSNLAVYSIIIHTCYIYLNNSLHKLGSEFWISGQSLYFLSMEYNSTIFEFQKKIFSNLFISKYLGYIVVLQQLLFIPLVFIRKTKYFILGFSILVHLGIAFLFLLVKFQFLMILSYGFFFNDNEIKRIKYFFSKKTIQKVNI